MDVTTRNRTELKSYFVKNSIPTESNFAELIDGMLNQKDDGLVKLPGSPLSVEAAGDSTSEKKVLQLYQSFSDQRPAWSLSLNPRDNSGDPANARPGFNIGDGEGTSRLFIDSNSGNVGVGTINPVAKLDVLSVPRTGSHPPAVKGLYVTGDFGADADGVEFRHSNATQGIGFGYNTIYAAGTDANQDLSLKPRGSGMVRVQNNLQVTGAITPSVGNESSNGIMFPANPFGGTSDSAWVRYHNTRGGEKGILEIGIGNDPDDHIVLLPSGRVGVGTINPVAKLDVLSVPRTGSHPPAVKGLYVTGDFGADTDGVEFRRSNATQGIGFGYNTIYAAGTDTNQDLSLKPRGTGVIKVTSSLQVNGYVVAQQVYFSAYVSANDLSHNRNPLPMQQTSQNVGNSYDITTSKFTAPVKGVYLFTMTGMRENENKDGELSWSLMVNDVVANSGGPNAVEPEERCRISWPADTIGNASRTILLALNRSDRVHVRQIGTGRCDNYRSGLEGVLLYATL